jgi:peptidoglycan/xylan/chitin deacetylase (PgdA/CDA1 family)
VRIPGLRSLRLSARWLRGQIMGGTLILGYHSIAEPATDAYSVCVTPAHFREQLEVLNRVGRVISLGELATSLQERCVPKGAVVLTFDDGTVDLLHHAKPLLEHYQAPATVFVTTGCLGDEFWWDRLQRLLFSAATSPEALSLQLESSSHELVPGDPRQPTAPKSWRDLVQSVYSSLLHLSPQERETAMAEIATWRGTAVDERPIRRAMTGDELIELASGDLIEIGAHTVTHPFLAELPIKAQHAEIEGSKAHLERLLGRPVSAFSYPNGSSSRDTVALVRESGFTCACASFKDIVRRGSDRFLLPRFWVQDWDAEAFSRRLRLWLPA